MQVHHYDDTELYSLMAKGSKQERDLCFQELYARYSQRVFGYCCRILGERNAAEDIFQETFLRFLNSATPDHIVENVPAYLLRIARNQCFNSMRARKHEHVEFEEFHAHVAENKYEIVELARLAETAMELLPEEHAEAFALQTYGGLSYNEIAEIQKVPLTTVRNRVVRAKAKLQKVLAKYLDDYSEHQQP